MSSLEMGSYPFDSTLHSSDGEIEEKISTAYGPVKVSIYGERSRHPIVTFHDIGLDSENNFQNFFQFGTAMDLSEKFCIYNINAPGQEIDSKPLPDNFVYPSMDGLAQIVASVVDHYGFKSFVGFGVGAGANVMIRYALNHQKKLDALILVNACITRTGWIEWGYQKVNIAYLQNKGMTSFTVDYLMWHHFGKNIEQCNPDIVRQYRTYFQNHPNPRNLAVYMETFLNRNDVVLRDSSSTSPYLMNIPVLQLVGSRSAFVEDTVEVNTKINPAKSEWVKVTDSCGLVLDDKPEIVTEAVLLFLQGLGYFATLNVRKVISSLNAARSQMSTSLLKGVRDPPCYSITELDHEASIKMDISLNFLKIQPLTNWMDYILNRQRLFDLLENPEGNESAIIQLADQFMEQALAFEKEVAQMQKKTFDEEDIVYMRYKINNLWLCALACFAASDWDLQLLVKSSNVIRIRTLMGRLLKCSLAATFDENSADQDIFSVVCQLDSSSLSSKNVFAVWLFSRWILVVDTNGRFPAPVAKPTVSNPANQVDQNLVQAEKLLLAIAELRKLMPEAVRLLDLIVNLPVDAVEVPLKECFYVNNAATLDVIRSPLLPNLTAGFSILPVLPLRVKTLYDLMVAHFASRHFTRCRQLLPMVVADAESLNTVLRNLRKLVHIESNDLEGYKLALNIGGGVHIDTTFSGAAAHHEGAKSTVSLAALGAACPANLHVTALRQGLCVSKRLIAKMENNSFRAEFLEAIVKELSKSVTSSKCDKQVRARLLTSLYFLCALSPKFSDAVLRHSMLKEASKWRILATQGSISMPPLPSNQSMQGKDFGWN
uniref:Uncharacterized protein n=1 Tax=Ditylenchus dipsaci TaxID=166011 RepID=A0A915EIP4_9BILA